MYWHGRVERTTWKFKILLKTMHKPTVRLFNQSLRPFLVTSITYHFSGLLESVSINLGQ